MIYKRTDILGCAVLSHVKNVDERGSFSRVMCKHLLESSGIDFSPVQSSIASNNKKGTMRGLHFQNHPKAEGKIVTCLAGTALYVVVDMRGYSKTFKNVVHVELCADDNYTKSIYIPPYCASGYQTLEDNTTMLYYMDELYDPDLQVGINCFSKRLNVEWYPGLDVIMSEKDKNMRELIV